MTLFDLTQNREKPAGRQTARWSVVSSALDWLIGRLNIDRDLQDIALAFVRFSPCQLRLNGPLLGWAIGLTPIV